MYNVIARPLQFYYELWPSYAGAITLLTLTVMLVLLPLTLKGTRSMLAMQKLQPELKKLQNQHRDDRQKLNEEVMKFYKENNINPLSGCMPLLLQMPIFIILYRTLHDLLWRASSGFDLGAAAARAANGVKGGVWEQYGNFAPKHLDPTSQLYQDLTKTNEMSSLGMNLAQSAQQAMSDGAGVAAPYILLVMAVAGTSYYQQRQIAGRPGAAQVNPQQQMLLKIMPVFFAFISLTLPAGLVVYFLVSNLFRIAQQALITRTMYKDHPGTIETTATDTDESSAKSGGGIFAMIKEQANASSKAREDLQKSKSTGQAVSKQSSQPNSKPSGNQPAGKGGAPSRSAPSQANRSKAKKKRR
ncbi:MAG: YidC/Oxa1 family membrane protein insertase [Microthrixaceae bacterium]|jgi:YidC/Oxa1 family membrane protein insertase|nr:YidC/Oxa1 family membrane protein insertase [Microthrixaceae bacterium]